MNEIQFDCIMGSLRDMRNEHLRWAEKYKALGETVRWNLEMITVEDLERFITQYGGTVDE